MTNFHKEYVIDDSIIDTMNELKIYGPKVAVRLVELTKKLHWLSIAEDGVVEIFLDNHMLQTFRACEASFYESFVNGYGSNHPVWFLALGTAVHKMIEIYYIRRKQPNFTMNGWAVDIGYKIWSQLEMDQFKDKKEYEKLGGFHGFVGLLIQYATHFNIDNERFRVIGTELYFGRNKEVPILEDSTKYSAAPFRFYLSGKIDLLIDDGDVICPMDHKTSKDFRGQNPMISYELQDGMTGYVYAARQLLKRHNEYSTVQINRKPTNKIWMNFLQIKPEDTVAARFKRAPLFKTDQQLEDYRQRQIRTVANIFNLIINPEMRPSYNTMMCNNWMHGQCGFHPIHRLGTDVQPTVINGTLQKIEMWNPEAKTREDKLLGEIP